MDYRGERSSEPFLSCPELDRMEARIWPEFPTDRQIITANAACHDRLAQTANLRHYGSLDIAFATFQRFTTPRGLRA